VVTPEGSPVAASALHDLLDERFRPVTAAPAAAILQSMIQEAGGGVRRVRSARVKRARKERELAREERVMAACDLQEAYLYGGPLEQERRQSAELHLARAREHERIAEAIERDVAS
jgi:hypothetical protein